MDNETMDLEAIEDEISRLAFEHGVNQCKIQLLKKITLELMICSQTNKSSMIMNSKGVFVDMSWIRDIFVDTKIEYDL